MAPAVAFPLILATRRRFYALRACGCVLSARGIRQVALAAGKSASTTTSTTATTTTTAPLAAATAATTTSGPISQTALLDDAARKALKHCPQCVAVIDDSTRDVVLLNAPADEYESARQLLLLRIDAERARKSASALKRKASDTAAGVAVTSSAATDDNDNGDAAKKARAAPPKSSVVAAAEAK